MAGIETTNTRAPCPSVRVITQDAKNMITVRRVRSRTPTDKSVFMRMMLKQTSLFVCNYVHHAKALSGKLALYGVCSLSYFAICWSASMRRPIAGPTGKTHGNVRRLNRGLRGRTSIHRKEHSPDRRARRMALHHLNEVRVGWGLELILGGFSTLSIRHRREALSTRAWVSVGRRLR